MNEDIIEAIVDTIREQKLAIIKGKYIKEINIKITLNPENVPELEINKTVTIHNQNNEIIR